LELDPDSFPDDDQVAYAVDSIDLETDWRRQTCPEGFVWDCCDGNLTTEPCRKSRHSNVPGADLGGEGTESSTDEDDLEDDSDDDSEDDESDDE